MAAQSIDIYDAIVMETVSWVQILDESVAFHEALVALEKV